MFKSELTNESTMFIKNLIDIESLESSTIQNLEDFFIQKSEYIFNNYKKDKSLLLTKNKVEINGQQLYITKDIRKNLFSLYFNS